MRARISEAYRSKSQIDNEGLEERQKMDEMHEAEAFYHFERWPFAFGESALGSHLDVRDHGDGTCSWTVSSQLPRLAAQGTIRAEVAP